MPGIDKIMVLSAAKDMEDVSVSRSKELVVRNFFMGNTSSTIN